MIRALISLLLASLSILPSVMSYAKVSRNGQEEAETKDDSNSWIVSNETQSEGRSIKNIAITMAPVYIAPKISNLHNGEAANYSPGGRYTTLDHEMLGKLNAKKQIQDRYHPAPLSSFKNKEPSKDVKESPKVVARPSNPPSGPPSSSSFDFSNPPFSDIYEYKPPSDYLSSKPISKPPDYLGDKPISKPLSMDDYADTEISDKPPDSYEPDSYKPDSYKPDSYKPDSYKPDSYKPDSYKPDAYKPDAYLMSHEPDYSDFPDDAPYNGNPPAPKPMKHSPPSDHPPYDANDNDNDDNDAYPHHHDFHHELIYDHIPEYHDHTEEPEMNDQRLDKRPYSYYFIGKKLWYVPLYFSIYFVIYIAALVLKSIARHKIAFPAHLADAVGHHSRSYGDTSWWDYAGNVLEGVESFAEKYGKIS